MNCVSGVLAALAGITDLACYTSMKWTIFKQVGIMSTFFFFSRKVNPQLDIDAKLDQFKNLIEKIDEEPWQQKIQLPTYASPEILMAKPNISDDNTEKTNVFALGVILFETVNLSLYQKILRLTYPPQYIARVLLYNYAITDILKDDFFKTAENGVLGGLIVKMLALDPKERPSLTEVKTAFVAILDQRNDKKEQVTPAALARKIFS